MNYKELLHDKNSVLTFYPELAVIFNKYDELTNSAKGKSDKNGLGKAIVINQLNYWLEINRKGSRNYKDGHYWVYKTYSEWVEKDFTFWSPKTVSRIFKSLENIGVIISANYNKLKIDKTKWYRIDYEKLQEIIDFVVKERASNDVTTCPNGNDTMSKAIPETTTDIIDAFNPDELKDDHMDASFSKKKEENAQSYNKAISKNNYTQSELKSYLPNKIKKLYTHENSGIDEKTEDLIKIIMYFYEQYKIHRGETHPILSDMSYRKIIMEFLCPPETMMKYEEFSFDTYRKMIDLHFTTEYGKYKKAPEGFNYRLSLFMSDNIREHLYRRIENL